VFAITKCRFPAAFLLQFPHFRRLLVTPPLPVVTFPFLGIPL
jgi:hypothetical protein